MIIHVDDAHERPLHYPRFELRIKHTHTHTHTHTHIYMYLIYKHAHERHLHYPRLELRIKHDVEAKELITITPVGHVPAHTRMLRRQTDMCDARELEDKVKQREKDRK